MQYTYLRSRSCAALAVALLLLSSLQTGCGKMEEYSCNAQSISYQDRLFLDAVSAGNLQVVDGAQLLLSDTTRPMLQGYAIQLANDYARTHQDLTTLASSLQRELPNILSPDYQRRRNELAGYAGRDLERAWLELQRANLQGLETALEQECTAGCNTSLKSHAETRLPQVRRQLVEADSLQRTL